jgi:predicted helicase
MPGLVIPKEAKSDDPFVQILDPATGTGTFLEEVVDIIYATMTEKWARQKMNRSEIDKAWNEYVPKHLLTRLRGFELMMAPYAVAHMKIGLKLQQTGYHFRSTERLRVFLTNTLEPPEKGTRKLNFLPDFLSQEAMQADVVKEKKAVTVVIGNPPYSGESANKGDWIYDLLRSPLRDGADSYFNVDGKPLGERNPKWLNDDYVKFVRYGQSRIASAGLGILGFITNHSYLDSPTFRGMRQSLMHSFQHVSVFDLHGNSKKGEHPPDGMEDRNVFEIQQGVAIGLFVRRLPGDRSTVLHADLWGGRETKYEKLRREVATDLRLTPLTPKPPFYLFIPSETDLELEYQKGVKITDIFPVHSLGIVTARDSLTIHPDRKSVWETVTNFVSLPSEEARAEYSLGEDAEDWKVILAQNDLKTSGLDKSLICPILYRPFSVQYTYYTGSTRGFMCRPRSEVMSLMLTGRNIAMHICRQIVSERWQHVLATNALTDDCYVSNKSRERGYTVPLFLPADPSQRELDCRPSKRLNVAPEFATALQHVHGWRLVPEQTGDLVNTVGGVDFLGYIYAVLHSPTYRSRYLEFLRRDFAHIPFTLDKVLFARLAQLGADLIALHILDESFPAASWNRFSRHASPLKTPRIELEGPGPSEVVERHPAFKRNRIYINPQKWFEPVSDRIWSFEIGAYQVCEKWLKSRRGTRLSREDALTFCRLFVALEETERIMREIDKTIAANGGWPLVR